jgi:hypothetical protein
MSKNLQKKSFNNILIKKKENLSIIEMDILQKLVKIPNPLV